LHRRRWGELAYVYKAAPIVEEYCTSKIQEKWKTKKAEWMRVQQSDEGTGWVGNLLKDEHLDGDVMEE
jgi:hypothetical protein